LATSAVEDADAEARVHGERTEVVSAEEAPARPGEHLFDDDDPDFADIPVSPADAFDPLTVLRGGGFEPDPDDDDELSPGLGDGDLDHLAGPAPDEPDADASDLTDEVDGADAGGGTRTGRRRRGRAAVPA
jgi:single-strand DNA-binding protein